MDALGIVYWSIIEHICMTIIKWKDKDYMANVWQRVLRNNVKPNIDQVRNRSASVTQLPQVFLKI